MRVLILFFMVSLSVLGDSVNLQKVTPLDPSKVTPFTAGRVTRLDPRLPVMLHDVTAYGSSSTEGNQDGTGMTYLLRLATVANTNGFKITNLGAGGANDTNILAQATNATTAQKAADAMIQYGGNGSDSVENQFLFFSNHVVTIGHSNIMAWVSHNASTETYGTANWLRARKLARYKYNAFPGKVADLGYLYRYAPPADATDIADQATDAFPTSYRANASHLNSKGYQYGADYIFTPWQDARSGGIPFIPLYEKLYSTESTAQTSNGFVLNIPYVGGGTNGGNDLSGVTPLSSDTNYSISVVTNTLQVKRATTNVLTDDYRLLNVTLTKGVYSRTFPTFISIGASNTAPKRVTIDGNCWGVSDLNFTGVTNGKKLTIVCDLEFLSGDSSTHQVYLSGAGVGVSIQRLTTGFIRIFVRDANSTGTSVASLTSTNLLRAANGRNWVFFCIDTTTGVDTAKMVVNDSTTVTSTPTADLILNLAPAAVANQDFRLFSQTAAGSSIANAIIGTVWLSTNYLDISVSGNRDLFRNSSTKEAIDLGAGGTVSGCTPFFYWRGTAGDYFAGKNFGYGGDIIWVDKGRATTFN